MGYYVPRAGERGKPAAAEALVGTAAVLAEAAMAVLVAEADSAAASGVMTCLRH